MWQRVVSRSAVLHEIPEIVHAVHHIRILLNDVREGLGRDECNWQLFVEGIVVPIHLCECQLRVMSLAESGRVEINFAELGVPRLMAEIKTLREKRSRVIETYLEGVISREDRDRILSTTDRELKVAQDILMRETPHKSIQITDLIEAFAPLANFACWTRDQKRSVLAAMTPDIRCADYKIESLGINPAIFSSENSHRDRDSWLRRA
jgi:hypothetical protein